MAMQSDWTRSAKEGSSASGDSDGDKPPNQSKGEHNDHDHYAEDLLLSDALIKDVVELLRAESLDFTVLDAIKRIAPQFGRQSGGTIIQLAYAIVAARACSSGTMRKNETAVTDDADEVKDVGEYGGHKSDADGVRVESKRYSPNRFSCIDDEDV